MTRQSAHEERGENAAQTAAASATSATRSGRRGNNEGSITRRPDGRWHGRMTVDGARRKHFYGKTRQEVAAQLTAALRDRDQGLPAVLDERQTLAQHLRIWLAAVRL